MVKIRFLLLIIIFNISSSISIGQAYHKLLGANLKWEQFQSDQISICGYWDGQLLFENGDTVISGLTYSCIYSHPIKSNLTSGFFCPPYEIVDSISGLRTFLREDSTSRKVYIYDSNNSAEYLLYDYNATDGDTLFNYYGVGSIFVTVDSMRIVNYPIIGARKTFYLQLPGSAGSYHYIEGVGGINGVDVSGFEVISSFTDLTCLRDSMDNSLFGNCIASSVGIQNNTLQEESIFHFNRISQTFRLKCDYTNKQNSLKIYNLLGAIIYINNNLTCNQEYPLLLNGTGIYIYKLFFEENENNSFKGKIMFSK